MAGPGWVRPIVHKPKETLGYCGIVLKTQPLNAQSSLIACALPIIGTEGSVKCFCANTAWAAQNAIFPGIVIVINISVA
jgi:hypothetical protein